MAAAAFWKGHLKLSLVTCAVALIPATTTGGRVHFRTLNRHTGNPVESRWVDAETSKPVKETARGYPREEDSFLLIEDEELDSVRLESTRTIDIARFAPADSIGTIWHDQPYFLAPTDPVGTEAFTVIRAGMEQTRTVGVSRLVLGGRERAVILRPRGKGIVLWSLRFGGELRDPGDLFADLPRDEAEGEPAELVRRLIAARTADWNPDMLRDPVQEGLQDLIAARSKQRKRRPKAEKEAPAQGNVIDIMDALRRSLAAEKKKR